MINSPLKNKKILVTGASSGIGAATSSLLAQKGAYVYMVARRMERLESVASEIRSTSPNAQLKLIRLDVTDSDAIIKLENEGALDIDVLINNAGLALGRDPVSSSSWKDAEQMLKVNVDGALRLAHAIVPKMLKQGSGDILNICSVAGHWTYQGGAIYCASKHALWAFTKVLREETCGKNLRVMQISPGMVETDFSVVRFSGDKKMAEKVYEGMTPLSAYDIAVQIVFMLEQPRHVCIDEIVTMPTDQGAPTTIARKSL